MERVVVAYSGGPAGTAAVEAMAAGGRDVVTLTVDVGQSSELTGVRERALSHGALRAHVVDARDEFAREYVWAAVQAGLPDTGRQAPRLALPLVARKVVDVARIERAAAVAMESTADREAFAALIASLDADLSIVTADDVALGGAPAEPTLWSRVVGTPADGFALTRDVSSCPDEAAVLEIDFVGGRPVRVNGIAMDLVELVESVETIAGAHGVGRLPATFATPAVEAPAAVVLESAYRACERASLAGDVLALKQTLAAGFERAVAAGGWFSVERDAIAAFVAALQPSIAGSVRLTLRQGALTVTGVRHSGSEITVGAR